MPRKIFYNRRTFIMKDREGNVMLKAECKSRLIIKLNNSLHQGIKLLIPSSQNAMECNVSK